MAFILVSSCHNRVSVVDFQHKGFCREVLVVRPKMSQWLRESAKKGNLLVVVVVKETCSVEAVVGGVGFVP